MDILKDLFNLIIHFNMDTFSVFVHHYQDWIYAILFIIIYCETGLVVTPFLPGDSLLFTAGAVAAFPDKPLAIGMLIVLLIVAAFTGDNSNYFIGRFLGHKVYEKNYKLIRREYLDKTHAFYEKHGGKTVLIARFAPILRTFAPFVAGVGTMNWLRFVTFSIVGNILWVSSFCLGGYFFGNIPVIRNNFSLVIFGIIFVSLIPSFYAVAKNILDKRKLRIKS